MFVGEGEKSTKPLFVCERNASQNILKFFSNLHNDAPRLRAIVLFLLSSPILIPFVPFPYFPFRPLFLCCWSLRILQSRTENLS